MWENSALTNNGVITVSSTWPNTYGSNGMLLTKEKITDGLPNTFWHSKDSQPSWMNYALNTVKTITKVTIGVRSGLPTKRTNDFDLDKAVVRIVTTICA